MKIVLVAALFAATLAPSFAMARSVKWSCVQTSPFNFVCSGSTSRP